MMLLTDSNLDWQTQNIIVKRAHEYIKLHHNPHHLCTYIESSPNSNLIYFERYNERTNCYEGEIAIHTIWIDDDGKPYLEIDGLEGRIYF